MQTDRIEFLNRDGIRLSGLIDWPANRHGGYQAMALFAHCFTCSKNLKAVATISRALTERGIAVMRFDFTGLGDSGGEFPATTFSNNVSDIVDAARWLAEAAVAPTLLIGHSLGGTAMLQAADQLPLALAVATIAAPSTAAHVRHLLRDAEPDIARDGEAEVLLAGRPFTIRQRFLDDLDAQPPVASVRRLRKALLLLHSPVDETVGVDNAATLFAEAMHPKSFVSLDKADHLLSDSRDAAYVGSVLAGWAVRYLPGCEPVPAAAQGHTIATTGEHGFRTTIQSGEHALVADEPAGVGGSNSGPTPHGLLAAALASCTSMTLQMYARRKNLTLRRARVDVSHEKRDDGDGPYDHFERVIELVGDLDAASRQRLVEIADRCPVHRTLQGRVVISNRLLDPSG